MMLAPIAAAAAIAGCPLFPRPGPTNQRVDTLPVAPDSAAIVRSIGVGGSLKADFGSGLWEGGPIGIPYDVVGRATRRSKVRFEYADESDRVRYPIPRGVQIEGGPDADGDRHALLVDRRPLQAVRAVRAAQGGGRWTAGSGATWSLRKPRLRPSGWTSADAAGPADPAAARALPGGQARAHHARAADDRVREPARVRLPGAPLRLLGLRPRAAADGRAAATARPATDISGLPRQARVVAQAMKEYGLIVADNGSDWYVSGAPHPQAGTTTSCSSWAGCAGSDFEVVRAAP